VDVLNKLETMYVIKFLFMFLIGGVTGLFNANAGLDLLFHDTYFVVAHFHFVLSLGAVVGAFGGFFYFQALILSNESSIVFLKAIYYILFTGSFLLFFPLHFMGLYGFPRRITDYPITYLQYNSIAFYGILLISLTVYILTFNSVLFSNKNKHTSFYPAFLDNSNNQSISNNLHLSIIDLVHTSNTNYQEINVIKNHNSFLQLSQ